MTIDGVMALDCTCCSIGYMVRNAYLVLMASTHTMYHDTILSSVRLERLESMKSVV